MATERPLRRTRNGHAPYVVASLPSTNAHVVQSGLIHGGGWPPKPPKAYDVIVWNSGSSSGAMGRISVAIVRG
jgi:hypothetical protein